MTAARAAALDDVARGFALHAADAHDPDLALLEGDRAYARGLERLASQGDIDAVTVLAELIATASRARAAGDGAAADAAFADSRERLEGASTGQDDAVGRAPAQPVGGHAIE